MDDVRTVEVEGIGVQVDVGYLTSGWDVLSDMADTQRDDLPVAERGVRVAIFYKRVCPNIREVERAIAEADGTDRVPLERLFGVVSAAMSEAAPKN